MQGRIEENRTEKEKEFPQNAAAKFFTFSLYVKWRSHLFYPLYGELMQGKTGTKASAWSCHINARISWQWSSIGSESVPLRCWIRQCFHICLTNLDPQCIAL